MNIFKKQFLYLCMCTLLLSGGCKTGQTPAAQAVPYEPDTDQAAGLQPHNIALNQVGYYRAQKNKQAIISLPFHPAGPIACYIEGFKNNMCIGATRLPRSTRPPVSWLAAPTVPSREETRHCARCGTGPSFCVMLTWETTGVLP